VSVPDQAAARGPVTVRADSGADPAGWAAGHREELTDLLLAQGAVLVSGLNLRSAEGLGEVRAALGLRSASLHEQFAGRRRLADGVYSAPDWPADREQCLHHEQGYGIDFPRVLLIACLTPARTGGATLIGDTRELLGCLPPDLVARFRATGWLLERNFRPHFGVSWSAALGASSPDEVEKTCSERLVGCTWESDGTLHLTQRRSAIVRHPVAGAECWFNDVGFFSQWSVDPEERQVLLKAFGERGIPFNARFGDGEAISEQSWRSILDGYEAVMRRVTWQAGDLLLVDNVLCAHGREPYTGSWELAIAPAETVSLADCSPTVVPLPRVPDVP
jgi:hypothetical protein